MASNIKYDIVIRKKDDILKTIQRDVTDGEVLNDIISSLERSIANNIINKENTSLPLIGRLDINLSKQSLYKNIPILKTAKKVMTENQYLVFKKELARDEQERINHERNVNWLKTRAKNDNIRLYKSLVKIHGENYALLYCYFQSLMTIHNSKHIDYSDYEE